MRTKTRRRLVLGALVAGLLGAGGAYIVRERQRDSAAQAAREHGLAAYERGDYPRAVDALRLYIGRLQPDALALLRYAQSVFRLPNPDAKHIQSAVDQLRRALGLEPDNVEIRRTLLEAAREHGLAGDIRQQADWFLERDPRDMDALVAKAGVLASQGQFENAFGVLSPYLPASAPEFAAQLLHLRILAGLERRPEEIRARAAEVVKAQRSDARFGLVQAQADLLLGKVSDARGALRSQIDAALGDRALAQLLVPMLDAAGLSADALRVLLGFEATELDANLRGEIARRLWEGGDAAGIVKHVASWVTPTDRLPTPVLGYWGLALAQLGRDGEASALADVLEQRSDDDSARAWAHLLTGVVLARAAPTATRIAAALRALDRDAGSAPAHFELGQLYRHVGEVDLALREYATAARLAPTWAEPLTQGARMLAQDGRLLPAIQAAVGAEARSSRDAGVAFLSAMVDPSPKPSTADGRDRIVARLEHVQASPRETLAVRLALAAVSRDLEGVRSLIESGLAMDPAPDAEELLACALLSRAMGLGLEFACEDRYEASYGVTPALALARARRVGRERGPAAGHDEFRAQRRASRAGSPGAWAAAEATLLESERQFDEALEAWRSCSKHAADDALLLRTILGASVPWTDRELVRSAIESLKAITTEHGLGWRFFRARLLMDQPAPDGNTVKEAIEFLRQILDTNPDDIRARLLLATTYERQGDATRALEQFRLARSQLRAGAVIDLRIARLLIQLGDWDAARAVLGELVVQVQQDPMALAPPAQNALAALLSRLGERRQALTLLDADSEAAFDPRALQGRAELYAAAGELERAEQLIRPVLERGDSGRALLLAAALAEFKGDRDRSIALLNDAASREPTPERRQRLRADFHVRVGRPAEAVKLLQELVDQAGSSASDWRKLLACQLELGDLDALEQTLPRAQQAGALAGDSSGPAGRLDAKLLLSAARHPPLRALASAYLLSPADWLAAAEALRIFAPLGPELPSAETAQQLVTLGDRYPSCMPLQLAVAEVLMRRGDTERALSVCRRASASAPMSPEPWRSMAYMLRAVRRNEEAHSAALEWRLRVQGLPLEPDVFLAQQASPRDAAQRLEPYVAMAAERDDADVLVLYGEAMLLAAKADELEGRLRPYLQRSPAGRLVWLELAALAARQGHEALAARWLEEEAALPDRGVTPRLQVGRAVAWQALAEATGREDARALSRSLIVDVAEDATLPPEDWVRVGQIAEASGDPKLAERAYRRALGATPWPIVAANNLALLLTATGRAGDGLPLAQYAVHQRGEVPAFRDTLATVHLAMGNGAAALAEYEECLRLEASNPDWPLRIARTLLGLGRPGEARRRWSQLRGAMDAVTLTPDQRAAREEIEARLAE